MLIDFDILKHFNSTPQRIKEVFTAQAGSEHHEHRVSWERKLESRIHEGAEWGLRNFQFYYAADMAMDTNVITKELVPLSLFAQNKITLKDAASQLKDISPETAAKFVTEKDDGGFDVDIPAFHKVVVALVRSFVTRRTAALASRYVKQTPLFKYEAIGTSPVASLRADVLSQRVETIANGYGYRHDLVQSIRDMLLYAFSIEFATCSWEKDRTLRKKVRPDGLQSDELEVEAIVAKEGIPFKRVHPTKMFFDMAYPLSSINTDTGCSYIGHWNLVPYRNVRDNPCFFNRSKILYDTSFASKLIGYKTYFALYSPDAPINFPRASDTQSIISANDREPQAGIYSTEENQGDETILLTEYFERVVPKDCGLGDYPYPVWVRLVVAADNTVVYGEFMPYTPAVYCGYNSNDNKVQNMSFAHDAIAFQDQCTNILTSMLLAQKAALIKIISLDIDQIDNPEHVKLIRRIVAGEDIFTKPLLIEHKGARSQELGHDKRKIVEVNQTEGLTRPEAHISMLIQLIGIAERLLGVSANEQGQSEPREISATESANIASVTSTSLAFMGLGVDEAVAAKKKILYQGLMSKGETKVRVAAAGRYTGTTIRAAGFIEDDDGVPVVNAEFPHKVTVTGEKTALEYNYAFTNRDGSERPSNSKSAQVLVLLFQQLAQVPGVLESMGKEGLYDFLNAIVRLSGAPIDVKFALQDGESPAMPAPPSAAPGAEVPMDQRGVPPAPLTGQPAQPFSAEQFLASTEA